MLILSLLILVVLALIVVDGFLLSIFVVIVFFSSFVSGEWYSRLGLGNPLK